MGFFDDIANMGKNALESVVGPKVAAVSSAIQQPRVVTLEDGSKAKVDDLPFGSIYMNEKGQKVRKLIKQPVAIESKDQMQSWLHQLDTVAPPAISVALQSQMDTLNNVFSASLAGMAIDNMLFSLQKALQLTKDENLRTNLRDNFCMMIQNFVFINEAKLLYVSEQNRMEAANLLGQAGAKMMTCAINIGMAAISAASGADAASAGIKKITTSNVPPIAKNPFEGPEGEKCLGDLAKALVKKKILEEKQAEFERMMLNLFPMFDRYYDMIGPSVLVTGLLERYCNRITEKYEIKQYTGVLSRIKSFQPPKKFLAKAPPTDYDYARALEIELNAEAETAKKSMQLNIEELEDYKKELKSIALNPLKGARRNELKAKISEQEREVKSQRDTAEIAETTRYKLEQILKPIKDDVAAYRADLMRVVEKYDIHQLKGVTGA